MDEAEPERRLAQDLLLITWDDQRGYARPFAAANIGTGIGGALLLEAVLAELVTLEDGRVVPTGRQADDPLHADVLAAAEKGRRPPKAKTVISRVGGGKHKRAVRDRMVAEGRLDAVKKRRLGLIPVTRHYPRDPAASEGLRQRVTALLRGQVDPEQAEDREVILASLTAAAGPLNVLVPSGERRDAKKRAEAFADGEGISEAVRAVVADAQAAVIAATAGAAAATSASS